MNDPTLVAKVIYLAKAPGGDGFFVALGLLGIVIGVGHVIQSRNIRRRYTADERAERFNTVLPSDVFARHPRFAEAVGWSAILVFLAVIVVAFARH